MLESSQITSKGIELVDNGSDFTGNIKLFTNPQKLQGNDSQLRNTQVYQRERLGGYPPFAYNNTFYGQGGEGAVAGKGHSGNAGRQGGL